MNRLPCLHHNEIFELKRKRKQKPRQEGVKKSRDDLKEAEEAEKEETKNDEIMRLESQTEK